MLTEAAYKHTDAALCRHFEIDETTVALPESVFGGKDERGRDITTSMLMPHRVIEPHGLSHSGLEHRRHGHTNTAEINIRSGRASADRSEAARAGATAHTARGHTGCRTARSRSGADTHHGR